MNLFRMLCFYLCLSPFIVIGLLMHFCVLGYEIAGPFFMKIMLPKNLNAIKITREEIEKYVDDYLDRNPEASVDDAIKAFVKSKGK